MTHSRGGLATGTSSGAEGSLADPSGPDRAEVDPLPRLTGHADVRLLVPTLAGWVAVAALLGQPALVTGVVAATSLALAATVTALGRRASRRQLSQLAAIAATTGLLLGALVGHTVLRGSGRLDDLAADRAEATVELVVTSEPVRVTGFRQDTPTVLVRGQAARLTSRGRVSVERASVLLRGDERLLTLRWRERVVVAGRLAPPREPADEEVAVLSVRAPPRVLDPPGAVARGAERLREGLRRAVDGTPADARGLLPGLVIGDTSRTPTDLTEAMQATGMTHLTAVSGSNVAVTLALVLGLCALAGVPRRARPWLAVLAVAGFVVLARPEPSVVRAATMGVIGLIGLSTSRRGAGLSVLAAAVGVLLVIDPWLARSFGFALSTLATLGLLLFTRPWGEAISARLPGRIAPLGPALAIPVAAQVMCAPLIVVLQGSVSLVGVLANLLAAPLVPVATVAGVAAALVAVVSPALATVVGWCGAVPTLGIAWVARSLADVPGGTLPWPDGPGGAVMLAGLTVLVLLSGRWVCHHVARRPVAWLAAVAVPASLLIPTRPLTWPPDGWRVVVCDVGQGDATVLRSGPHRAVLVDTGPDPPAVDGCLDRLGVDTLDAVILTHFHADHVEGLPGAIAGRAVAQLLTTPVTEPAYQAGEVRAWARARGIPVGTLDDGDSLDLGDMHAQVWAPARRIDAGSVPNNASVVLAVRVGEVDALLLGDVEREAAHDLLLRMRRDPAMASQASSFDLVKTPHHGSANLDPALMAAVRAPVGVVSVGVDNDYGHPTAAHLEMLRRNGYAVRRTDRDGDVACLERGGRVRVVTLR